MELEPISFKNRPDEDFETQQFTHSKSQDDETQTSEENLNINQEPYLHDQDHQIPDPNKESDRKTYRSHPKDPYKEVKDNPELIFYKILYNNIPTLPTGTKEQYAAFQESITRTAEECNMTIEEVAGKIRDKLSPKDKIIFSRVLDNLTSLNPFGFGDVINNENPTNDVIYGGYDQVLDRKQVKPTDGKVSPEFAFARFQSILGLGHATIVVLYHSGFSIVLNPPTQAEFLKLQLQIFASDQELGYSTSGYFNTAKKSRVIAILKEYIQTKIITCTLDVDKEDIFDYVSYLDLDLIILGLLRGGYEYIPVSRTCFNILNPDNEAARCTHTIEAKLNPSKLLQISRHILTDDMLSTLAKRGNKVVSIPEQSNYVVKLNESLNLKRKRKDKFKFTIREDVGFEVRFKIPTVNEYINASEEWIVNIEKELDKLLETNVDITRENAKSTIETITKISSISSGIQSVLTYNNIAGTKDEFKDNESIMSILQGTGTTYSDILPQLQQAYVDYVNNSPFAYVATPAYECPSCRVLIGDDRTAYQNEKLIGFNVIDFFFMVVGHQTNLVTNQTVID